MDDVGWPFTIVVGVLFILVLILGILEATIDDGIGE